MHAARESVYVLSMNMFIPYMHRASSGREIAGSAVVVIFQLLCVFCSLFVTLLISLQLPSFMNINSIASVCACVAHAYAINCCGCD